MSHPIQFDLIRSNPIDHIKSKQIKSKQNKSDQMIESNHITSQQIKQKSKQIKLIIESIQIKQIKPKQCYKSNRTNYSINNAQLPNSENPHPPTSLSSLYVCMYVCNVMLCYVMLCCVMLCYVCM